MTKAELKQFKQILEQKKEELERIVRRRDGIAIEKSPDTIDEMTRAAERELAIRNLDRETNLLRNVKAALRRIDEGTYGICIHCEEPINPRRLQAIPWTPFCVKCQEAYDRNEQETVDSLIDMLISAA